MIGLLVSLAALLLAAAGGARHIWLQHIKLRREHTTGAGHDLDHPSTEESKRENKS
jgi:hypothetical protein